MIESPNIPAEEIPPASATLCLDGNLVPFFSAFADYVHSQRNEIGRRWMHLVRTSPDVPGAMHISAEALQDHVPELLNDLVERLRQQKAGAGDMAEHSRSHGREQWKAGYNISDLIWEIYIIRRVLTQSFLKQSILGEFAGAHPEYSANDARMPQQSFMTSFIVSPASRSGSSLRSSRGRCGRRTRRLNRPMNHESD